MLPPSGFNAALDRESLLKIEKSVVKVKSKNVQISNLLAPRQLYATSWQIRLNTYFTQLQQWNNREENKKKWRYKGQCNAKVRKIRKAEASKDQLEDTSSNQDEKKDRDESIDEGNDKEIAGNGDKWMKKSQRILTLLSTEVHFCTKFSRLGRPLVLWLIRAYWFYVETSFAVCTVGFYEYEKSSTKDH